MACRCVVRNAIGANGQLLGGEGREGSEFHMEKPARAAGEGLEAGDDGSCTEWGSVADVTLPGPAYGLARLNLAPHFRASREPVPLSARPLSSPSCCSLSCLDP